MSRGYGYFAFLYGKTQQVNNNYKNNGIRLAKQCIDELDNLDKEQFPPRLLILLTPPDLTKSATKGLLAGIDESFNKYYTKKSKNAVYEKVPLIGGSVAAVFFDGKVHPQGALLICLASRLLEKVEIGVAAEVSKNSKNKIDGLLKELKIKEEGEDVDPFANRMLLTFFPGFRDEQYVAGELHDHIRQNRQSLVPIFGGGTHGGDRKKTGWQFANSNVYEDTVVAARITSGIPISLSLSHGLTPTNRIFQISSGNGAKIESLDNVQAVEIIDSVRKETKGFVLLERIFRTEDTTTVVENPRSKTEGDDSYIEVLRKVRKGQICRVIYAESKKIQKTIIEEIKKSKERIRLENPIACLGFKCAGHFFNQSEIALDFESEFASIEKEIKAPYIGAFFNGEAGMDRQGRSALYNWSTATMVFGDELRDRTLFYQGFAKLAEFARQPLAQRPADAIKTLLQLIYDIGYPGAMLSLVLNDEKGKMIVAQNAYGHRFSSIVEITRRKWDSNDILAQVARNKMPEFVSNVHGEKRHDQDAANKSGIISHYIIPLLTLKNDVIAVLQVDLADARYKNRKLHAGEKAVLDALGNVVSSNLNRIFSREENEIIRQLDEALSISMSKTTIKDGLKPFIEEAVKAFGLKMGHIRVFQPEPARLILKAGVGNYYELALKHRREIKADDPFHSARANDLGEIIVLNNPQDNDLCRRMYRQLTQQFGSKMNVEQIGSYINVPFKSESGEKGVISLVSDKPWFFNWFHEDACLGLGRRVGSLIDHLRQKEEEAETRRRKKAIDAKVALVAQSSHDFKDYIGNLLAVPKHFKAANRSGQANSYLKIFEEQVREIKKTVNHHLDLANKAERVNFKSVNVDQLIGQSVERTVHRSRVNTEIEINVVYELNAGQEVEVDAKLIAEAISNIINNSINAMMKSPNTSLHGITVSTRLSVAARNVEILIEDTGGGMDEETLATVNNIIMGTRKSLRSNKTGFGLAIAQKLLDVNDGRIESIQNMQNENARGVMVKITLPLYNRKNNETKNSYSGRL